VRKLAWATPLTPIFRGNSFGPSINLSAGFQKPTMGSPAESAGQSFAMRTTHLQ
jgi:hypothetical protein